MSKVDPEKYLCEDSVIQVTVVLSAFTEDKWMSSCCWRCLAPHPRGFFISKTNFKSSRTTKMDLWGFSLPVCGGYQHPPSNLSGSVLSYHNKICIMWQEVFNKCLLRKQMQTRQNLRRQDTIKIFILHVTLSGQVLNKKKNHFVWHKGSSTEQV